MNNPVKMPACYYRVMAKQLEFRNRNCKGQPCFEKCHYACPIAHEYIGVESYS